MTSDFYKNLPRKRMGAGVLLFNEREELLLVKTTYKEGWTIPGGIVEENESPRQACLRETQEEIGIALQDIKFLCVDYTPADSEKNESLQFIFYGGVLNQDEIERVKISEDEISEYRFLKIEDALPLLRKNIKKRVPKILEAIKSNAGIYLEDGE